MADSSLVNQLLNDLKGEDKHKARYAAFRLSQLEDDRVLNGLLDALHHKDAEVRAIVAQTLSSKGTAAIPALTEALGDRSRNVRRAAARSLGMIGSPEVLTSLVGALLGDENSFVRWEAAKALGSITSASVVPELLEALSADSNSYVRYAAAEALGTIGEPSAVDGLEDALTHDANDFVRYAAATALGQIGDASSAPILIRALNNPNSHVWHAAAEALWSMEEHAMPALIAAIIDESSDTRRAALKGILWLSVEYDEEEARERSNDEWVTMWGWWN